MKKQIFSFALLLCATGYASEEEMVYERGGGPWGGPIGMMRKIREKPKADLTTENPTPAFELPADEMSGLQINLDEMD